MTARALTDADLDWAVETLSRRRETLVTHAPLYWNPADDAEHRHREFLSYVLRDGGGFGWRTDTALLIAATGRTGLTIDDASVSDELWPTDGEQLWRALVDHAPRENVRFVCPVPETERHDFAVGHGLVLTESWWHLEVSNPSESPRGGEPAIDGATALVVPAPPVYNPGDPVLFLTQVSDPTAALTSAELQARDLSCPLVVVNQSQGDNHLESALSEAGFRRHCDFLDGTTH